MTQTTKKDSWSSLLSFVWVAAGAAIGLGNIWKFPYMAGNSGGSAFVLCYLFFVFLVAAPIMAAEFFLGVSSRKNPIDAFLSLAKANNLSKNWAITGYLGLFTLWAVFCFYSVVAGFSLAYILFSLQNKFYGLNPEQIQTVWQDFLSNTPFVLICSILFIFFTMSVVFFGIKKGIEKSCSLMMPALLVLLSILVIYGFFTPGFFKACTFLFSFDISKLSSSVILSALGHAFFTLAVGACAMMVYGAYLPKNISIFKSVFIITLLDLLVALLSGLAIFPLIFAHDLSPSSGPGLMFISLPVIFASMPFGSLLSLAFFILLFFAALSSSISFAEPLVFLLIDKFNIKRNKSVLIIGTLVIIGSTFCSLSFNLLNTIKIFNKWNIFDFFADISTNLLLPIGGLLIAVFAYKVIKIKNNLLFKIWQFLIIFISPIAILAILFHGFLEIIS